MGRIYRFDPRRGQVVILVVFLALGLLWLAGNWPRLLARFARVDYLSTREVRASVDISGILVANERVLVAPAAGRIQWLAPAGLRVFVGEPVARITSPGGGTAAIDAPAAGLLSYTSDGLESVLRPGTLPDITMPSLAGIKSVTVADGQEVNAGQTVGRVADNLDPVYIYVAKVPPGMPDKSWHLTWQGRDLRAVVSYLRGPGGGLFLKLDRYPDKILDGRVVNFAVVTQTLTGRLVPQTALAVRDGQTGIYLDQSGQAHWVKVQVAGRLSGMVKLAGLPRRDALYVVNPLWVREGVPVS